MTQTEQVMKTLPPDTPVAENEHTDPNDPYQTGSGSSAAPGGADGPAIEAGVLDHGELSYPGTPDAKEPAGDEQAAEAGDTDPDSTKASDETGQGGDPSKPGKNTGNPWNG